MKAINDNNITYLNNLKTKLQGNIDSLNGMDKELSIIEL